MEEEVILEQELDTVEEEIIEESDIEEVEETEEAEFDPDEEGFDEDEYTFEGYDLSAFKDKFDFSTEENVGIITKYLSGLQDQGFTQAQVEFLIEKELSDEDEEEPKNKPKTAAEIREELKANLTQEERRNYKAVNAFVADMLEGSELSEFKKEIMSNPNLVKLMHVAYQKSLGKTGNINKAVSKKGEKTIRSVSYDDAYEELISAVSKKNGNAKEVADRLMKTVSDKESFSKIVKAMGLL